MKLKEYKIKIKYKSYNVYGIIRINNWICYLIETNNPNTFGYICSSEIDKYKYILFDKQKKWLYGYYNVLNYGEPGISLKNELNKFIKSNEAKKL